MNWLLDIIYPPICVSCEKWGNVLCQRCIDIFTYRNYSVCPCCLKNSPHGLRHDICTDPQKPIDGLLSYFRYTETLKKTIKQIKYQGYYTAAEPLVQAIISKDATSLNKFFQDFLKTNPIIVPIPIHKKRYYHRGFNQSDKIAHQLQKIYHLPYSTKLIQRHSYTRTQAELSKTERKINMVNSFSPTKYTQKLDKPLKYTNILLVDDVWTTGSTMQNAAIILKQLGAETIWAFTLAR